MFKFNGDIYYNMEKGKIMSVIIDIRKDHINNIYISTISMNLLEKLGGPYETMAFPIKDGDIDFGHQLYFNRATTKEEAIENHEECLKMANLGQLIN